MAQRKREQVNKKKVIVGVIIEIVIMATEILCCLLPMPWRLAVPIAIGARSIIAKAVRYVKSPPTTPIVYCSGVKEPKNRSSTRKKAESKNNGK